MYMYIHIYNELINFSIIADILDGKFLLLRQRKCGVHFYRSERLIPLI